TGKQASRSAPRIESRERERRRERALGWCLRGMHLPRESDARLYSNRRERIRSRIVGSDAGTHFFRPKLVQTCGRHTIEAAVQSVSEKGSKVCWKHTQRSGAVARTTLPASNFPSIRRRLSLESQGKVVPNATRIRTAPGPSMVTSIGVTTSAST